MKKYIAFFALAASVVAHAADSLTLMVGWYLNPSHTQLIVAKQKGFFEEQGIDLTIQEPTDTSIGPRLAAAKKVDLAITSQPQLYLQHEQGIPLVRVATLADLPVNSLLLREDSSIQSIADLKGKTIGYSLEGYDTAILGNMLATANLSLDDIKLVNIQFAIANSLMSKQVDAVIGGYRNYEPFQMQENGVASKMFYPEDYGVPLYDEMILVAHPDNAAKPVMERFNAALEKATAFVVNHPEEGWEAFISYNKERLDTPRNHHAYTHLLPHLSRRPAAVDYQRYRRFGQYLQQNGLIKQVPKVEAIAIDPAKND